MADFLLDVQPRTIVGKKVNRLRRQGFVPMTVYGPKTKPVSLQAEYRPLEIILMRAGGTNLIDLSVDGATYTVLAREVQRDPIRGEIRHVDFFAVDLASKIRTDVPIHYVNESPAVQMRKGILLYGTNTLTVEVLPGKLIHSVEVDLSVLKDVTDVILVGNLRLDESVTIVNDPEEMIVRISQSSAARAEEDLDAETNSMIEPEVVKKGKIEEEDFD